MDKPRQVWVTDGQRTNRVSMRLYDTNATDIATEVARVIGAEWDYTNPNITGKSEGAEAIFFDVDYNETTYGLYVSIYL